MDHLQLSKRYHCLYVREGVFSEGFLLTSSHSPRKSVHSLLCVIPKPAPTDICLLAFLFCSLSRFCVMVTLYLLLNLVFQNIILCWETYMQHVAVL